MDDQRLQAFIRGMWQDSIVPRLLDYIRIPNKSPLFDPNWQHNGYMEQAVALAREWCEHNAAARMSLEVIRLPGRTPLLYIDIAAQRNSGSVLLYGHLDKQPEMAGWRDGLGPWSQVLAGDKLYGRGGADDGYAVFASLCAVLALQEQGVAHPRVAVLIECCEESGSFDLVHYIEHLAPRIGTPDLVICLDSGCGNYDQLWCTTSLRGLIGGNLRVEVLREGVHSGDASGIVPSSFRVLRQLLSRLEFEHNGQIADSGFYAEVPEERVEQAELAATVLGNAVFDKFPFAGATRPVLTDRAELILNRTWRPALEVTGAAGFPALDDAGNVLRPSSSLKLSLRLPPTLDAHGAATRLKELLEAEPPYGARVNYEPEQAASGWHAPLLDDRLSQVLQDASLRYFGGDAMFMGEGGSIPFMRMLGERYPQAQFVITGVLGPQSNAHGPNEFLHLHTAERLTCCAARLLAEFRSG